MKRFRAFSVAMLFVIPLAAGCGRGEKIAARVNGDTITEEEFLTRVQNINAANLAPALQGRGPARAGELAMMRLIEEKLIFQLATEKKAMPTPEQINHYVAFAKKYNHPAVTLMPGDPFRTEEDWQRDARIALVIRNLWLAPLDLKEADARKIYDQIKTQLVERDQYHLRLIDTKTQAKAQKALDSLKKGVPFETVALKESDDPSSAKDGGSIGWQQDIQLPQPILQAVKNLKPGEHTTKIIRAPSMSGMNPGESPTDHFFLAQLVEKKPGRTPTFEEVKLLCENEAMRQKDPAGSQRVQQALLEFQNKANIQITMKPYENLMQRLKQPSGTPSAAPPGAPAAP